MLKQELTEDCMSLNVGNNSRRKKIFQMKPYINRRYRPCHSSYNDLHSVFVLQYH